VRAERRRRRGNVAYNLRVASLRLTQLAEALGVRRSFYISLAERVRLAACESVIESGSCSEYIYPHLLVSVYMFHSLGVFS